MKTLYIIKTGTSFSELRNRLGDFDQWTASALGPLDIPVESIDAENGAALPMPEDCAGAVITGSHSMVTDEEPWSVRVEEWIKEMIQADVPLLGICYGHQLLAKAAGGQVGFHPKGREVGTVSVAPAPACSEDPLFKDVEDPFAAHVVHSQTVLDLPDGAVRLAANQHEPNHAFRLGQSAWGVQFHPEYDARIMKAYLREMTKEIKKEGRDVDSLIDRVSSTPVPARIIQMFGTFVAKK